MSKVEIDEKVDGKRVRSLRRKGEGGVAVEGGRQPVQDFSLYLPNYT